MSTAVVETRPRRNPVPLLVSCGLLAAGAVLLAVFLGVVAIAPAEIVAVLTGKGSIEARSIILDIRLPRIVTGVLAGIHFAIAGLLLQAITRNPLADPSVMGVSQGATLGVTLFLLFSVYLNDPGSTARVTALPLEWLPAVGMLGGLLAGAFIYLLAFRRDLGPLRVTLCGVAVGSILHALAIGLIAGWGSARIDVLLEWLAGSLYARSWDHALFLAPFTVAGLLALYPLRRALDLLQFDPAVARSFGLSYRLHFSLALLLACGLAASAVGVVGPIVFVGLIVPHMARTVARGRPALILPAAIALGAIVVTLADLVGRLADIDRAELRACVVVGGTADAVPGLAMHEIGALDGDPATLPALTRPIEPWDVQSIIYTSGTTGRSKGVISSYAHLHDMSGPNSFYMLDETDCFLLYGPLFHVGGTLPVVASLNRGGAVGVAGEFSTEGFWPAVRATRATFLILLGVMTSFIAKRPPGPDDRDHTLRKVMMIPLADDWRAFAGRFGMTVWTLFNMTEINVPIVSEPNPAASGTCGKARAGLEIRIVDDNDCEVADGTVGELILRTDAPWALNSGYFRDAEATARAWRNGWFHTGDAFRRDAQGNFFFVDRMKDAIRRRGENISSFEVEVEILAHPQVRECAVVAVPNETSEDDVLAIVAPIPGATIDPVDLLDFLRPRLAHFMLPRYIRVLENLPRTPTQKVEKHVLRSAGISDDTWDRERAGIKVAREKIRG